MYLYLYPSTESMYLPQPSVSPVIPKSTPGEYRLIHNLSPSLGNSGNSFIPPELTSVKYQKLEDVINIIKQLVRGTLMSKLDIKDVF